MASNQVNLKLVHSLVEQAVRENGTPEEQANRLGFLIRQMKDKVLSMEEEPPSSSVTTHDFTPAGMHERLKRHEESELTVTQRENVKLKTEIARLKRDLKASEERFLALRRETTNTIMSETTDSYSFAEFKRLVIEKHFLGRNKEQGWQQFFVDCNTKGYNQGHMKKWKASDAVPVEAIQAIDDLDLNKKVGQKMERWKPEEINAFREYVVEANGKFRLTKTHAEIASDLSIRFGRNLNENSIKSKMNAYKLEKKKTTPQEEVEP